MNLKKLSDRKLAQRTQFLTDQMQAAEAKRDGVAWKEVVLAMIEVLEEFSSRKSCPDPAHLANIAAMKSLVEADRFQ